MILLIDVPPLNATGGARAVYRGAGERRDRRERASSLHGRNR